MGGTRDGSVVPLTPPLEAPSNRGSREMIILPATLVVGGQNPAYTGAGNQRVRGGPNRSSFCDETAKTTHSFWTLWGILLP